MTERQDTDIVQNILPRYCEGLVTEEECTLVEDWMSRSEENNRIAEHIFTINLATDIINILEKVDTERALTSVSARMTKKSGVSWFVWIQRIAAVLLIPVLIILFIEHREIPEPQMMLVKTNPGMTTTFDLPDGSTVHLNSESLLYYPSRFDGSIRNVELIGEAFFSVSKNKEKRFVVSIPHKASVEVLGTVFNIEAFSYDSIVSTTLIEGQVKFNYENDGKTKAVLLKPGQKLVYNSREQQAQLLTTTGISETAWKDGMIIFTETPLLQALRILEKHYDVEFVITTSRFDKDLFTGSFKHQRLERVLEVFRISSKIRWRYINADNVSDEKTKIEIY